MKITHLDDNYSVSEQITLDDIKILADEGVKILVCNRPDGEEANQITCAEIESMANTHGIDFFHIPAASGNISSEALNNFTAVLEGTDDRVHAYCRTGTRSSIFWQLSQQQK
jgi:sulfide:quinone oxidoreductase